MRSHRVAKHPLCRRRLLVPSPRSQHMLSARFKPYHVPLFLAKYAWLTARRRPILVHFEVTMRCNARCGFCDYWKTPAQAKEHELKSFADAAKFFNPMMVTFTGGEPTLRRDLEDLVSRSEPSDPDQIHCDDHARRDVDAGARVGAMAGGDQPVQHLARLSGRAARHRARHPGLDRRRSSGTSRSCGSAVSTRFASTP